MSAEDIARRWMKGTREGPGLRYAWEHPQDLVNMIMKEMPTTASEEEQAMRVEVAWLHDILEDGEKENGARVEAIYDLAKLTTPEVLEDVLCLTRRERNEMRSGRVEMAPEPKEEYLSRFKGYSPRVRLVKCVDRICNLREGKTTFKDHRWIRYVGETYYFIYPLAKDLPEGPWLQQELLKAAQARQV